MRAKERKMLTDMIADVLERHGDVRIRRGGGQSMLSDSRTVAILSDTGDDITIEWLRTDHERIYVATPKIKALIDPKIADEEALQLMDYLARP